MKITNLQASIISGFLLIMGLGLDQINLNIPGLLLIALGTCGILAVFGFNFYRSIIKKGRFLKRFFSSLSSMFTSSPLFSFINQQIKHNVISSFSPTLSELKLTYDEYPTTAANLNAISTKNTYDVIKSHILNQREAIEIFRAYLPQKRKVALDEAWYAYAEPQKEKVPSDPMIEYWGMDEPEARKTAIERIEKILEFVK